MNKRPHNYAPDEKVTILKTDLIDQIPISDICHQYNPQPTVFTAGRKRFLTMVPPLSSKKISFAKAAWEAYSSPGEKTATPKWGAFPTDGGTPQILKSLGELWKVSGLPTRPKTQWSISYSTGSNELKFRPLVTGDGLGRLLVNTATGKKGLARPMSTMARLPLISGGKGGDRKRSDNPRIIIRWKTTVDWPLWG